MTTSILLLPILIIDAELRSHSGSGKRGGIYLIPEFTIRYHKVRSLSPHVVCCLSITMTLASGGESNVPACGPPASFSVHLTSRAVTPAGSVHKSKGDNVVRMWVQL